MPRRGSSRRLRSANLDRIVVESDEEELRDRPLSQNPGSGSQPDGGGFAALTEEQQDELTRRMVRFMLCRQARCRPVRRPDLSKHVFRDMQISSRQRVFTGTFNRAQTVLRNRYGMELAELTRPVRRSATGTMGTATGTMSQSGGAKFSKAYILISVVPPGARVPDRARWPELGLRIVVASMVMLTPGCRISEEELYRHLNKIGVDVLEGSGHKMLNGGNVKELIEKDWTDQWYLDREFEGNSSFFTLGPRMLKEVEDQHLVDFVDAIYQSGDDSSTTLDDTAKQELLEKLATIRQTLSGTTVDDD